MPPARRALVSVPALLSLALLLPASAAETTQDPHRPAAPVAVADPAAGEAAYAELPALPVGDGRAGAEGVRRSAIALAASLRAVPVGEGSDQVCPEDRLEVSWEAPGDAYGYGAHVEPLGPAPGHDTTEVNGVVVCGGSPWAFMGFEARYLDGRWAVVAVPFVAEEDGAEHEETGHTSSTSEPVRPPAAPGTVGVAVPLPPAPSSWGPIDGYAAYEPQRTCSPTAKPGTVALQRLLLDGAPGSRNLGITRACHIGGSSEHKEGRAFDWGVLTSRPTEAAAAEEFLRRLLATDEQGNRHALARRMGVMYVIWNRQIWSAYRPDAGWRPYEGRSAHTDHVHVSLSWAGALGRTSYWSGTAVPGLALGAVAGGGGATATPVVGPAAPPSPSPADIGPRSDDAAGRAAEQAHRRAKVAEDEAHRQARAAEEEARRQAEAHAEEVRRQAKAAEEEARRQAKAHADEQRRVAKAAEEEARRQQKAAEERGRAEREAAQVSRPKPAPAAPAPAGHGGGTGGGKGKGKG